MSDLNLPNDGVPTFGWFRYTFRSRKGCGLCNRKVYVGIISLADRGDPELATRVMCTSCYRALDRE